MESISSSKEEFFSIWDNNGAGGYILVVSPKSRVDNKLEIPDSLVFDFQPFRLY